MNRYKKIILIELLFFPKINGMQPHIDPYSGTQWENSYEQQCCAYSGIAFGTVAMLCALAHPSTCGVGVYATDICVIPQANTRFEVFLSILETACAATQCGIADHSCVYSSCEELCNSTRNADIEAQKMK